MRRILILCLLLVISQAVPAEVVKIGLRAHSGAEKGLAQWQATADYLSERIPEHTFVMVPVVGLADLMEAVGREEFDFVLTNPSSSVEMEERFGATQLVTLKNLHQGKPHTVFGSVVFTRKENTAIKTFNDLKGKKIIAVSERAFGGWRVAWREMLKHGIDPQRDFAALNFSGNIQENVVYAVRDGKFDAGVVRTDMLERMAARGEINLDDYAVINPIQTPDFPFLHSTTLYPEWPFSKLKKTSSNLAQKVALALLTMPASHEAAIKGQYEGWTVVEDYLPVKELMQELKLGPYKLEPDDALAILFDEFGNWIILIVLGLLMVMFVFAYVLRMNRRLASEKSEKDRANNALRERVKEINCLYTVSRILTETDDVPAALTRVVEVLPPSWLHPEVCSARIVYQDKKFVSKAYVDSIYKLSHKLKEMGREVGTIEVCYAKHIEELDDGPFLKEEVVLLNEIAKRLNDYFDRCFNVNVFRDNHAELEARVEERTAALEDARQKAEQANRTKSEFLSRVSHELRTPLNAILGYSQLLLLQNDKSNMSELELNYISEIKTAGDHLLALINDVLDISRIEQGKLKPVIESVSVTELTSESLSLLEPLATDYQVELVNAVPDDLPEIDTDKKMFKQILINIVANGIKYNKAGGSVTVTSKPDDGYLIVDVKDTGPGIPESMHGVLFEPFARLKRDTATEGVGLGLSVVKGLVDILKGSISLDSKPGEGSCFRIRLPLKAELC
jgi:two-component system sensor histidine kinase TtrS